MFSIDYPDTARQNVILATNKADIYAINLDVIFWNHYCRRSRIIYYRLTNHYWLRPVNPTILPDYTA